MKSNSSVCLPGVSASGPSQLDPLQVDQVPEEHRLALEQVEAVAAEPAALGHDHALGAALRDLDLGLEVVRGVEDARRVAVRRAGQLAGLRELIASGRNARTRRDEAGRHRRVQRQHLVFLRLGPEQLLHLLELFRVLGGDVVGLGPVLAQVIELLREAGRVLTAPAPSVSQGGRMTLVLAIQPSW